MVFDGERAGFLADVQGHGDRLFISVHCIGPGAVLPIKVNGLSPSAPDDRMVAPKTDKSAVIVVEVPVLRPAPAHRHAGLFHVVRAGLDHVPFLRKSDLGAVIDDRGTREGKLAERGNFQAACVPIYQPEETVDVVVVEKTGTAEICGEEPFVEAKEALESGQVHGLEGKSVA